jgi:universal stress protein E
MWRIQKILALIDPEATHPAVLAQVDRLARGLAAGPATVELLSVIAPTPWFTRLSLPRAAEAESELERRRAEQLEVLAARLRRPGLDVATRVVCGKPAVAAAQVAAEGRFDLLIVQAGTVVPQQRATLDVALVRAAPCPVWLVEPESKPENPNAPRRLLAAVDPALAEEPCDVLNLGPGEDAVRAALAGRVLDVASAIAAAESVELYVVHAWNASGVALLRGEAFLGPDQVSEYVASVREAHAQALAALLDGRPDAPPPDHVLLLEGDAAEVIRAQAEALDARLIVMGTVARTGVPGWLLGSTATTVLRAVRRSVLTVKPEGAAPLPARDA